ncbi:MAG: hypothetical protein ACLTSZ_17385 [Lachnospiraceae bacterium]
MDMKSGYRRITYQGKEYQYNSLITTILYAGIDSEGEMKASNAYSNKARADSISLVILDKKHQRMRILCAESRHDDRYPPLFQKRQRHGQPMPATQATPTATVTEGEVSCEDLAEAVSNLLGAAFRSMNTP